MISVSDSGMVATLPVLLQRRTFRYGQNADSHSRSLLKRLLKWEGGASERQNRKWLFARARVATGVGRGEWLGLVDNWIYFVSSCCCCDCSVPLLCSVFVLCAPSNVAFRPSVALRLGRHPATCSKDPGLEKGRRVMRDTQRASGKERNMKSEDRTAAREEVGWWTGLAVIAGPGLDRD